MKLLKPNFLQNLNIRFRGCLDAMETKLYNLVFNFSSPIIQI